MTEHYEDIIHNGQVVGRRLVSDAAPAPVTATQRAQIFGRMTPVELHRWYRAAQRAAATNSPTVADRNALYAWLRWEQMDGTVDLSDAACAGWRACGSRWG